VEPANEGDTNQSGFKGWLDAMAARIKTVNPNVLVGTGTGNNDGNQQTIVNYSSGSNVDLISYHGYYQPAGSIEGRANGVTAGAAQTLNKPWYAGERGFGYGGGSISPTADAQNLTKEFNLYLSNQTCAGYLYWNYMRSNPGGGIISPTGPMMDALHSYANPYPGG
jgi:hypothetical protein